MVLSMLGRFVLSATALLVMKSFGVGKSSTSFLAGVKVGRVHLCRMADNTV